MHANARLNLHGRRLLIARIQQGRPVAHVADELGISRQTAYKWWGRWRREGDVGCDHVVQGGHRRAGIGGGTFTDGGRLTGGAHTQGQAPLADLRARRLAVLTMDVVDGPRF